MSEHVAARDRLAHAVDALVGDRLRLHERASDPQIAAAAEPEACGAANREPHGRGARAGCEHEVVLELPVRAAVDDVDPGIDAGEAHLPERGHVRPPGPTIAPDEVVDLARQAGRAARSGMLVRAEEGELDRLAAAARDRRPRRPEGQGRQTHPGDEARRRRRLPDVGLEADRELADRRSARLRRARVLVRRRCEGDQPERDGRRRESPQHG